MTSVDPKRSWKKKIKRLTDELIDNADFRNDAKHLKNKADILLWAKLASKYKLHPSSYRYVMKYIKEGILDIDTIAPPVTIVSEADSTVEPTQNPQIAFHLHKNINQIYTTTNRLYFEISPDSTLTDIENFIRENSSLIRDKMDLQRPKKVLRQKTFTERDKRIYKVVKGGKKITDVASDEALTPQYVSTIVRRQEKRH